MPYTVISFGGGLNSTALITEWLRRGRGRRLDLVMFADTGGELPETYAHVQRVDAWLQANGHPGGVVMVRYATQQGQVVTLEQRCLDTNRLPSLAYGWKKCSQKFKRQPQEKYLRSVPAVQAEWAAGRKVLRLIGYDADEPQRAERAQARYNRDLQAEPPPVDVRRFVYEYPLIQWDMGRDECADAVRAAGFDTVGKSACFFCPSTSNAEIAQLAERHPDLLRRALAIEDQAESTTDRGLGGARRRWRQVLQRLGAGQRQPDAEPIACGCYDGESL